MKAPVTLLNFISLPPKETPMNDLKRIPRLALPGAIATLLLLSFATAAQAQYARRNLVSDGYTASEHVDPSGQPGVLSEQAPRARNAKTKRLMPTKLAAFRGALPRRASARRTIPRAPRRPGSRSCTDTT